MGCVENEGYRSGGKLTQIAREEERGRIVIGEDVLGAEHNTTIVFPIPLDLITPFFEGKRGRNGGEPPEDRD